MRGGRGEGREVPGSGSRFSRPGVKGEEIELGRRRGVQFGRKRIHGLCVLLWISSETLRTVDLGLRKEVWPQVRIWKSSE